MARVESRAQSNAAERARSRIVPKRGWPFCFRTRLGKLAVSPLLSIWVFGAKSCKSFRFELTFQVVSVFTAQKQAALPYPFGNRSLTQPFTPHRTYRPLSDHSVSAIARDWRACSRYSLHRYSIYFLGGIRWWILFRLNCSNYKLVLKPSAPTANTSGNRFLMNSEARRWKCSGLTRLRFFIGS